MVNGYWSEVHCQISMANGHWAYQWYLVRGQYGQWILVYWSEVHSQLLMVKDQWSIVICNINGIWSEVVSQW